MIFDLPTQTPTKPLLKKLNWMSVMDRVEYRRATMVYKSLNRTAPDYMKKIFKFVTDVSQRETRFVDNSKLYLPRGNHLKVFTDSFQYAASAVWNKLPVHVREAESSPAFKSAYIVFFLIGLEYQGFLNDFICF